MKPQGKTHAKGRKQQEATALFALGDRLRIADPVARKRVIEITCQMVESMTAKGEVNPDNAEELKNAIRECARDAWEAYKAAEEFTRG